MHSCNEMSAQLIPLQLMAAWEVTVWNIITKSELVNFHQYRSKSNKKQNICYFLNRINVPFQISWCGHMHGSFVGGWGSYCPSYRVTSYWAQGGGKYKVGNQRLQYIEVFWFLCETFPSALLGQIWSDWQDQISTAENFTMLLDILNMY